MLVYIFEDRRYEEKDIARLTYEQCEILETRLQREIDELDNTLFSRQIDFKAGKPGFTAEEYKELKDELTGLKVFFNTIKGHRKELKKSRLEKFQEDCRERFPGVYADLMRGL